MMEEIDLKESAAAVEYTEDESQIFKTGEQLMVRHQLIQQDTSLTVESVAEAEVEDEAAVEMSGDADMDGDLGGEGEDDDEYEDDDEGEGEGEGGVKEKKRKKREGDDDGTKKRKKKLLEGGDQQMTTDDDDPDGSKKKRAKKGTGGSGPKKQYREGETNSKNFETIIIALTLFKQKEGNLKIPYKFIIPSGNEPGASDWPEDLWGLKLGARLKSIRRENNFANHREELDELGVEFEALKDYKGFEKLRDALKKYKAIHNDLAIPYCYVVPKDDENWTEDMWGMKLGMRIYDIRYRGTFKDHKEELKDIGVDFENDTRNTNRYRGTFESTLSAVNVYQTLYPGTFEIPYYFVVPSNDSSWPEELWRMRLGVLLNKMKNGKVYSKHRKVLEDMGFFQGEGEVKNFAPITPGHDDARCSN